MKTSTIIIETFSISKFEDTFNSFVKKVTKMGLEVPTFTYGEKRVVEKTLTYKSEGEIHTEVKLIEVIEVNLNIESSYKLNGWELLAVVKYKDSVVIPFRFDKPFSSQFGLEYHKCDHCGTNHSNRRTSFIVSNGVEEKQVGSSCSKMFLGLSENEILSLRALLHEFHEIKFYDGSEDEEAYKLRTGRRDLSGLNAIVTAEAMNHIISVVESDGGKYISAVYQTTKNRFGQDVVVYENGRPVCLNAAQITKYKVLESMKNSVVETKDYSDFLDYVNSVEPKYETYTKKHSSYDSFDINDNKPSDILKDEELFNKVFSKVEFFNGYDSSLSGVSVGDKCYYQSLWHTKFDEENDSMALFIVDNGGRLMCKMVYKTWEEEHSTLLNEFEVKLKSLMNQNYVQEKDINVIASAYAKYLKVKSTPVTKHIGTVGGQENLTLEIKEIKTGIGNYGFWTMYIMKDSEGNDFTKFGTINNKFSNNGEVGVGSIITASFEIKEHKEFNGLKQTVLGRLSKVK